MVTVVISVLVLWKRPSNTVMLVVMMNMVLAVVVDILLLVVIGLDVKQNISSIKTHYIDYVRLITSYYHVPDSRFCCGC